MELSLNILQLVVLTCHLKVILSYQAGQDCHLDTLNSKICPLFQILDTEQGWCNNSGGAEGAAAAEEDGA